MPPANLMALGAVPPPRRFAGIPLASLAFGLRNWLGMILALAVAFWLQLDSASSAAVCVGILALPTQGQVLQKAMYRVLGTLIGVTASFVIAGLFNEVRDLFLVAFAAWLGLCVFAAGFLDGNRAYGAVLSGYTVAIVAVAQIDAPQDVFDSGVNRAAAIMVGILAIMVVNDVFVAPSLFPALLHKVETLRGKVQDVTLTAIQGESAEPGEVAGLYAEIAALHPDITALPAERPTSRERAAGARTAAASMVRQIMAARAVAVLLDRLGSDGEQLRRELIGGINGPGFRDRSRHDPGSPSVDPRHRAAAYGCAHLLEMAETVHAAVDRMRAGTAGPPGPSLPIFRAPEEAVRAGLRTFLAVLFAAVALSVTGWPEASLGLAFIGATLGIGGTNAKPPQFALAAMVAMPLAVLLAGVTQFFVLDGADGFPALALAMAPPVIGASILLKSGNAKLVGLGFLVIVFFPVLLSPSNPQNYDPQAFLNTSVLAITAVIGVFVLLSTLLPVTDTMRRTWLLRSARIEAKEAAAQGADSRTPGDAASAAYRDASRLAQLNALPATGESTGAIVEAMRLMELSAMRRTTRGLGSADEGVRALLLAAAQAA